MITRHLSDSQLIVACQPVPDDQGHPGHGYLDHVEHCPPCRARHDAVARMLDDARRTAELAAEDAFPLERLAQQRDRILARVDELCRAGKILTFPSAHPRNVPAQPSHRTRWVAAAAAAGLVVGLLGGHLTRDFSSRPSLLGRHAVQAGVILRPARPLPSEDELLGQVEVAFEGTGPSALRTLDALTPVAWDVR
jgi:hypothetical protein